MIPLSRLARTSKSTRTLLKVPVLELLVMEEGAERTLYQFGTVANVNEIVSTIEEQANQHTKAD